MYSAVGSLGTLGGSTSVLLQWPSIVDGAGWVIHLGYVCASDLCTCVLVKG